MTTAPAIRRLSLTTRAAAACLTSAAALLASCDSPTASLPPGRVVWRTAGQGWPVRPSFDSTTVYFGAKDHRLVALDRNTGEKRWEAFTSTHSVDNTTSGTTTLVAGDLVLLGDIDIYAFDRRTGARRWIFQAREYDYDELGDGKFGFDGSAIYVGSLTGRVYAIDAAMGTQRWTTSLVTDDTIPTMASDPVVRDGVVYVGVSRISSPLSGSLVALDAATGHLIWRHDFELDHPPWGPQCLGDVTFFDSMVIAGVADGTIRALDIGTGARRWTGPRPTALGPWGDDRGVLLVGNVIVATSTSGQLVGLDPANGAVLWGTQLSIASTYRYITTDGTLAFVSTGGGEIVAVNAASGQVVWRTGVGKTGGNFAPYTAVDGDRLYANGYDGFYALRTR